MEVIRTHRLAVVDVMNAVVIRVAVAGPLGKMLAGLAACSNLNLPDFAADNLAGDLAGDLDDAEGNLEAAEGNLDAAEGNLAGNLAVVHGSGKSWRVLLVQQPTYRRCIIP